MKRVYTLDQARDYFLSNPLGSVMCEKDGGEKVCASYPEAQSFYDKSIEDDSSSISSFSTGLAIIESFDSTPSIPDTSDTSSSFDSGGGDFGGGGGGSDW